MTAMDLIIGNSSAQLISEKVSFLAVTDVSLTVPRHSDTSVLSLAVLMKYCKQ